MIKQGADIPLAGISVLVTRAVEQSAGLVEDLAARGAEVAVIPAVSITPVAEPAGFAAAMSRVGLYENVVFTSVNGVRFTLKLLRRTGMGAGDLPPALCVGGKTADAWEEAGGEVADVPDTYTAESLLDMLGGDLAGRHFLIMRPGVVKTDLGRAMRSRGAVVDEIVVYCTVTPEEGAADLREMLKYGKPDVIFFASPSAIDGIVSMAGRSTQDPGHSILAIPAVCIGPTTAKAAEEAGFKEIYFPDRHTAEGMVEELMVISGKLKPPGTHAPGRGTQE